MTYPGATILDADGLTLSAEERAFFREADPWGFILFARNVDMPEQVRRLTGEMREAVGREAVVLIDQEGGRVQRLRGPHWRDWPAPLDVVARAGPRAGEALWLMYRLIAAELREIGVTANAAPTCDIAGRDTHPFLRNRCLGTEAFEVVANARAVAEAHLAGGVLPVIKHMPGHGRASTDSHADLPRVAASLDELEDTDFAVFRHLGDLPAGMTAHVVFEAMDAQPATTSAEVVGYLREGLGFGGLLMTDDTSMKALKGSPAEKARAARGAGCDLVLFCNQSLEDRRALAEAAGRMSAAEAARGVSAMRAIRDPEEFDAAAAAADFAAILGRDGGGGQNG